MKEKIEPNSSERVCSACGAAIPADAPEGLCPGCLLNQGAAGDSVPRCPPFEPPSVSELAGLFPQLEILALIGKGGMGAVYKARQPSLDRVVALKILPRRAESNPSFAERFNREARALARLNHPNIVSMHEFGEAGGLLYFIMEFVDGVNLRQLQKARKLSAREALQIVAQICDALQYAHDEGIVHRDIKPENILIDRKGRVKIADFGLAKIAGSGAEIQHLTVECQVMGTPHYMAPEQLEHPREVDHRADIFSLGVVFYELLTGELPLGKFDSPSQKVQVDNRLDEIVLRALEKEPGRRYQRAEEMKTQVSTVGTSSQPTPSRKGSVFGSARLFWIAILAGVLVSLTAIVLQMPPFRRHTPPQTSGPSSTGSVRSGSNYPLTNNLIPAPDSADSAVARRKIQFLNEQLNEVSNKVNVGLVTSLDYEKAKAARDIAVAELAGDKLEAARIKLRIAELDLAAALHRFEVGRATTSQVKQAEYERDVAQINYLSEQKKAAQH